MRSLYNPVSGILFLTALLMTGCASTDMTSEANPEISTHHYDTILVVGDFSSLKHRKSLESEICEDIVGDTTTKCIEANSIFFPGDTYTPEEIEEKIRSLHIDGVLTMEPTGSGTSSTYIPPTTYVTGSAYSYGNTVSGTATAHTYGGFSVHKPFASYTITLFSIVDNKMAWYATAQSRGNAFASWDDLIEDAADECIDKLIDDGVLQEPPEIQK
jgi:hypothetical protein